MEAKIVVVLLGTIPIQEYINMVCNKNDPLWNITERDVGIIR